MAAGFGTYVSHGCFVYIMTSASTDEVASWFDAGLGPDEVSDGFVPGQTYEAYSVPSGVRAVTCWWD